MPFLLLIFLLTHMADGLSFLNFYYITLYAHAQEKDAGAGSSAHELDGEEKEKSPSCGSIGEEEEVLSKKKLQAPPAQAAPAPDDQALRDCVAKEEAAAAAGHGLSLSLPLSLISFLPLHIITLTLLLPLTEKFPTKFVTTTNSHQQPHRFLRHPGGGSPSVPAAPAEGASGGAKGGAGTHNDLAEGSGSGQHGRWQGTDPVEHGQDRLGYRVGPVRLQGSVSKAWPVPG